MFSAMVGVVVMAAATAAMVAAVQINEQAMSGAGRQALSPSERLILDGRFDDADLSRLEGEIKALPYTR